MSDKEFTLTIPTYSVDLIEQLARDIPALRVQPTDPITNVMFKAGQGRGNWLRLYLSV